MIGIVKNLAAGVVVALAMTGTANAGLIGDEVLLQHQSPSLGSVPNFGNTSVWVTVEAGTGDLTSINNICGVACYTVDIEESSIWIEFAGLDASWFVQNFNGLVISDLDWVDGPGIITGLTITSSVTGWNDSRANFGDDFIQLNFAGLPIEGSLHLLIQAQHIPVPATLALFGFGLLGLGAIRRRKTA